MRQRGKQSAASLEASPSESTRPTLRPPPHLSASEARLFNEVVTSAPSGQFSAGDVYLLTSFVRVTLVCDQAIKALAKANDKTRPTRMKMLDQGIKMQALLATKLRLATMSRRRCWRRREVGTHRLGATASGLRKSRPHF